MLLNGKRAESKMSPRLLPREGICLQTHEGESKQGGWRRMLAEIEDTQDAEVREHRRYL